MDQGDQGRRGQAKDYISEYLVCYQINFHQKFIAKLDS